MATNLSQDLHIVPDESGLYDLVINEDQADFDSVSGLDTAILVSLFTDARAPSSVVINASRRRGWVGNILYININRELGSLLWLLDQSRGTQKIYNNADLYIREAFAWMIEDGIASTIDIFVSQQTRGIFIFIDINAVDNIIRRYQVLWRRTENAN